jgi:hypothetical protein
MPYAFVQDVPADETIYRRIRELLPSGTPAGLVTHIAAKRDGGGLRYIDVWKSKDAWDAFRDEHLEPVVDKVLGDLGLPHTHDDVAFEDLAVIDVWLGA